MGSDFEDDSDTETTAISEIPTGPRTRSGRGFLTVLSGKRIGNVIVVDRESVIGRGADVRVVIPDEGVSRAHAKVVIDRGGKARLLDLGSTNGTFLNGDRIEDEPLRDNDRIQLGRATTLMYRHEYRDPNTPIPPISAAEALAGSGLGNARPTMLDRDMPEGLVEEPMRRSSEGHVELVEGVAKSLDNLGNMYEAKGDFDRAIDVFKRSLAIHERKLGAEHATVGELLVRLGTLYAAKGDLATARDHAERASKILELATADDEVLTKLRDLMTRLRTLGRRT